MFGCESEMHTLDLVAIVSLHGLEPLSEVYFGDRTPYFSKMNEGVSGGLTLAYIYFSSIALPSSPQAAVLGSVPDPSVRPEQHRRPARACVQPMRKFSTKVI